MQKHTDLSHSNDDDEWSARRLLVDTSECKSTLISHTAIMMSGMMMSGLLAYLSVVETSSSTEMKKGGPTESLGQCRRCCPKYVAP